MAPQCEVCGAIIKSETMRTEIDGAIFYTCNSCAKLGKPYNPPRPTPQPMKFATRPNVVPKLLEEPQLELRKDVSQIIRKAREKKGFSQEQLGRMLNEKPSVIRLLESGKLKPDDFLARKLEHALKVELFEAPEEAQL